MKHVFTDGCCIGNSGPPKFRKAGSGVHFPDSSLPDISQNIDDGILIEYRLKHRTNQVAELFAILLALQSIEASPFKNWTVHTDSTYAMNASTKWVQTWKRSDWKLANKSPVKNMHIIQAIDACVSRCKSNGFTVAFKHVKAHQSDDSFEAVANNKADYLAKSAAFRV